MAERTEPGRARVRVANVLLLCAAALVPWIVHLAATLDSGEYVVRRWGVAWVGLAVAEFAGLVATGLLVRRRDHRASPPAAATGTLFLVDAWFDTVTSRTGTDSLESIGLAWATELPLCVLCAVIAWRSSRWARADGQSPASG